MKVLVLDTYYPTFLIDFYRQADMAGLPFQEQRARLLAACFGTSNSYSRHLKTLGIESEEIIANCAPLQIQWAREHRVHPLLSRIPPQWTRFQVAATLAERTGALLPIVEAQIRQLQPDVLYLQDLTFIPPPLLRSIKSTVRLVVGQIACPLPPKAFLEPFDLILTSFPHYVPRLRETGLAAEYFRLGFEPAVLERVWTQVKEYACSFIGGISPAHARGTAFLEHLARSGRVDFFGYGAATLAPDSPIRSRHHGPAWALDMYRALARSHITVNRHVDVAENHANNMRLYEATGMGTMLLTDAKSNLGELFEPGKEVVAYQSAEHAVELIEHYSAHPGERDAIARAGQLRTLREHTYQRRMVELSEILERHLSR